MVLIEFAGGDFWIDAWEASLTLGDAGFHRTYPEIAEKGKAYAKAVNAVAAVAGNGLDALKPAVSELGDSCKGCHDELREKKN